MRVVPRTLITGGAGFIGSHLADALLLAGHEVYALDDLSTGSLANVEHLRAHPDFHLVVDSVLHHAVVNELVHKCDEVYHLAAAVGVRLIVEQPVHTITTNIRGTEIVLDLCARFDKRVLLASTSEIYGDRREPIPLHEDDRRIYGPTTIAALGLRRDEGDRRVPGARLAQHVGPRGRRRAPLQHRRPAPAAGATAWCCRASSSGRWPASRSRCTATGASRAASSTSTTACGR